VNVDAGEIVTAPPVTVNPLDPLKHGTSSLSPSLQLIRTRSGNPTSTSMVTAHGKKMRATQKGRLFLCESLLDFGRSMTYWSGIWFS